METVGRRAFLREMALYGLGFVLPREEDLLPYNPVIVRPGDTLSNLCDFYGIADFRPVALHNKLKNWDLIFSGTEILLPLSVEELTLPFCGINIPGIFEWLAITTGNYNQWCSGNDPVSFFAYMDNIKCPYLIEGHSQQNDPLGGPFGVLRKLKLGSEVNLLRGRDRRWLSGTVFDQTTTEDDKLILERLNSKTIALTTCKTETDSPRDSLVYFVKIKNYYREM